MNEVPGMFRTWKDAGRVFGALAAAMALCFGIVAALVEVIRGIIR